MRMRAKFAHGFCRECRREHIEIGEEILWEKGRGAAAVACIEMARTMREQRSTTPLFHGGDVTPAEFAHVEDHLARCCGEATDGECICGLIEAHLDGEDYGRGFGRAYQATKKLVTRVLEIKAHRESAQKAARSGNYFALRTIQCEHGRFCQHDACWCNDGEFFAA